MKSQNATGSAHVAAAPFSPQAANIVDIAPLNNTRFPFITMNVHNFTQSWQQQSLMKIIQTDLMHSTHDACMRRRALGFVSNKKVTSVISILSNKKS
jgi:hypothetical protein